MLSGLGLAFGLGRRARARAGFPTGIAGSPQLCPDLWLTVLLGYGLLQGGWHDWNARDLAWNFVWPTRFTFVGQIVVFYPAFFRIKSARSKPSNTARCSAWPRPTWRWPSPIMIYTYSSWIFYFLVMLLGGVWAGRVERMGGDGRRHLAVLGLTMLVYVGVKLGMVTGRIPTNVVVLHALTVAVLYTLLELATEPVQSLHPAAAARPRAEPDGRADARCSLVHGLVYESRPVRRLSPFHQYCSVLDGDPAPGLGGLHVRHPANRALPDGAAC